MTALEKLQRQRKVMSEIFNGNKVKGEDVAALLEEVIKLIEKNHLFERDVITGKIRSLSLSDEPEHFLELPQAQNLFKTFFCDKMFIVKDNGFEKKMTPLQSENQNVIFNQMLDCCTYNSRLEVYARIPKWDGVERIKTFMKDYFMCDTNWHFFLLFLTYLIGKIHSPETCRVEHWFDFVGAAKGTGKTTFFKHLLAGIGCERNAFEASMNKRSNDDFWVDCYNANAMIVIDDECRWLQVISYDDLKAMVTAMFDTFSRKHGQPETHARPFVIVRTSNHPKTVYSLNERRQIIFNIGLPEHTCLHWKLDNNYMAQMLAEAKAYYEEHGVYELTDSEKNEIIDQNLQNTSTETPEYHTIEKFVEYMEEHRDDPKYWIRLDKKDPVENYQWTTWTSFMDWAADNKVKVDNLKFGSVFWKNLEVFARQNAPHIWYQDRTFRKEKTRTAVKVFGIAKTDDQITTESLPDMPF